MLRLSITGRVTHLQLPAMSRARAGAALQGMPAHMEITSELQKMFPIFKQ